MLIARLLEMPDRRGIREAFSSLIKVGLVARPESWGTAREVVANRYGQDDGRR
jgi:hypothetical protein